jgi:WD40 repeat protein
MNLRDWLMLESIQITSADGFDSAKQSDGSITGDAASLTFSPNGQQILTGSWDGLVKIWDATNGQELVTFKGPTAPVNSVAFSGWPVVRFGQL